MLNISKSIKSLFALSIIMLFAYVSANASASSEEKDYLAYLTGKGYAILESGTINQAMIGNSGYMDPTTIDMPTMPRGVIGMKLADFDNDGQNEMLVILSEPITTDRFTEIKREGNALSALMLKKQNGAVVESGAIKSSFDSYGGYSLEIPLGYSAGNCDVFVKYINGRYLIGFEIQYWATYWYDGIEIKFMAYEYKNGLFSNIVDKSFRGSYFDDDDMEFLEQNVASEIKRSGFEYQLLERTIDIDKKLELITTIEYDLKSSNNVDLTDIIFGDEPGTPIVVVDIKIPSAIAGGNVAQPGIKVTLNGTAIKFDDQQPIIENDRTLVPLRAIFEALGATVSWNEVNQSVTSYKGFTTITLQIGSNIMTRNGVEIELDVSARLVNGRTMVPVRAVAESFGVDVRWDDANQTVILTN